MGISLRHYVTLSYVANPGGISQQHLAQILMMDANNVVLLLNELEHEGWVRRVRDPADRRRHLVEITDAGQGKVDHAQAARETVEDDVLANLDASERETLRRLLDKAVGDDH